jgi:APA family basic amino acid/polyamine antiporter
MGGSKKLRLFTGVGLVMANMIGAGVFLSAGFMAQDLGPWTIILAWVVGTVLALAGTLAYSGVVEILPKSGGEYRFLSELLHPWVGYVAGWASILIGFSGPIAIDAIAAGSFLKILVPGVEPQLVGVVIILGITAVHAFDLGVSKWAQNGLVTVKVLLVVAFVALGLFAGSHTPPTWSPPNPSAGFPIGPFMASLFFIAFAFSGWNAEIYAIEEFEHPKRDVPRAMFIGCSVVALLYLAVNWIFVANLDPGRASVVFQYDAEKITLGHVIASDIVGEIGGQIMSGFMVLAFVSATSAMVFAGPRVYAAMARDGFLPRVLAGQEGKPPVGSVLLQGGIALVIMFTHDLRSILYDIGAILTLFSALTAAALVWTCYRQRGVIVVSGVKQAAAVVYVAFAGWMIYFGLKSKTSLLIWIVLIIAVASIGYLASRKAAARKKTA